MTVVTATFIQGEVLDTARDDAREWFTAAELAELGLPGVPNDKRAVNRLARDQRWRTTFDTNGHALARPRQGRGGGDEYHFSLLPGAARLELARRQIVAQPAPLAVAEDPRALAWRWYENQSGKVKEAAEKALAVIQDVEKLETQGLSASAAVAEVARMRGIGGSTVWEYRRRVNGVLPADRLPALAPRRRGGGVEADIDPQIMHMIKSDFLRPEEPPFTLCYEEAARYAAAHGIVMPCERTVRRRLERDVDPRVKIRLRKGAEALRRSMPAQRRTVEHLHALECVNIDGHTFDVKVINHKGDEIRPILIGIQDIRSSKLLAWRVCETESAHHVRLVFGSLFEKWGIPVHCVLDNGRGFASKWITGGVDHRFRGKVLPSDPVGLLTRLDIKVHWALPYRGQSKPIERAWMDLTNRIARSAFIAGAYTGSNPTRKPDNYGSRVVPWDEFVAHVDQQIARHNEKTGRRGRDYKGRSFDQVFSETYANAPIAKATPEQLRQALLMADRKRVNSKTGEIDLFGTRYWSEAMDQMGLHGQEVTVRFDPDDLRRPIYLYSMDGRYLCEAAHVQDVLFLNAESAKERAKIEATRKRAVKAGIEAEALLNADRLAAAYQSIETTPIEVQPKVIRPVRVRGSNVAALREQVPVQAAQPEAQNRLFNALSKKSNPKLWVV